MIEAGDIRWALNPCSFLHQKQLADTYSPQTLDARTSSLHYLFRQYLYAEPQRRLDEAGYLSDWRRGERASDDCGRVASWSLAKLR